MAAVGALGYASYSAVEGAFTRASSRWSHASACSPPDPMRVTLGGVPYELPSSISFDIEADFEEGGRTSVRRSGQICGATRADTPIAIRSFAIRAAEMVAVAKMQAGFEQMDGLLQLRVFSAPYQPIGEDAFGERVLDGMFIRIERSNSYELISTGGLLFGSSVRATCLRAPTATPGDMCSVWGRTPVGSQIRILLLDTRHPPSTWDHLLNQVEIFLRTMLSNPSAAARTERSSLAVSQLGIWRRS